MTSHALFLTRSLSMALAGVICALYAILVVVQGRPDPLPFWIPSVVGVAAALAIWASVGASRPKVVNAAFDEGYRADSVLAERMGFWVAIALHPIFGAQLYMDWISWPSAFAAMGTLTAATYLLGSAILDFRGR